VNVVATQFHPEKSRNISLQLLKFLWNWRKIKNNLATPGKQWKF
jgi:hypothetical protein